MARRILITGSEGLIGSALVSALRGRGDPVRRLDLRCAAPGERGDVRDPAAVAEALRGCRGVVHLAAVSRVVEAERDPDRCWSTNVDGTAHLIAAALRAAEEPWLLLASSREVFGDAGAAAVTEDTPIAPVNAYGRSKAAAEALVAPARAAGLAASIVRMSNVYGPGPDHPDRVVPAFVAAAARGEPLRVDGGDRAFDFTHVDDVIRGLLRLTGELDRRRPPPPIHLITGTSTSLGALARLTVELAGSASRIQEASPCPEHVAGFRGDPDRAAALLDWHPEVSLREGLARLLG